MKKEKEANSYLCSKKRDKMVKENLTDRTKIKVKWKSLKTAAKRKLERKLNVYTVLAPDPNLEPGTIVDGEICHQQLDCKTYLLPLRNLESTNKARTT